MKEAPLLQLKNELAFPNFTVAHYIGIKIQNGQPHQLLVETYSDQLDNTLNQLIHRFKDQSQPFYNESNRHYCQRNGYDIVVIPPYHQS